MRQDGKVLGLLAVVAAVIIIAGCTGTDTTTDTGVKTPAVTAVATTAGDEAFLSLYDQSVATIGNALVLVNSDFYSSKSDTGVMYSPSELRLSALDMKNAAEGYHTSLLKIEKFASKDNEYKRNEHLRYLSTIGSVGGNIAAAAKAEGDSDYRLAMNYAELSRTSLERIEGVPNSVQMDQIGVMKVHLDDYIQRMRDQITPL